MRVFSQVSASFRFLSQKGLQTSLVIATLLCLVKINREALFYLRERSGYTRSQLAREAGTTPGSLTDIETGRRSPSPEMAKKLAKALEVPVTALLRDPAELEGAEVA